jgi:hypothetical protein
MRTTLTLDDDLAGILRRRAREMDMPFRDVVNAALRKGLADIGRSSPQKTVKVRPHDFGSRPGIDFDRLNQLNDELEVEEYLKKAKMG